MPRSEDEIRYYDSDHTALVHVLWDATHKGLDLDNADKLAQHIMRSKWFRAVKLHAVEAHARELDPEQFRC